MSALSPQTPAPGNSGENESIISLLEHFKDDDGRVALLVKELQELSNRVQVAELATVDPRLTTTGRRGTENGGGTPHQRGGSPASTADRSVRGGGAITDAVHRGVRRTIYHSPKAPQSRGGSQGGSGDGASAGGRGQTASAGRVEEVALPDVPEDPCQPLPLPPGGHEWEALQAAVNDSVAAFGAAAAKMGWKKWALTRAHSALLVSLFWWVVAAAFRSDHPLSRPLQDFAFGHFCRHYGTVVLQLRGKARDQYQQVWMQMMAAAALYLLAEVFPRSQHKFDDGLRALITKQLRLWTAGALPSDMHPSAHADAHDASPAAFSIAANAAAAAAAAAATAPPPTGAAGGSAAAAAATKALSRSPMLPPAATEAQSSMLSVLSGAGKSTRPSSTARISPVGSTRNSVASGRASVSAGVLFGSPEDWGGADGADGGGGPRAGGGGGAGYPMGPQAFVFTKNSPVMVRMLLGGGGGAGAGAGGVSAADGGVPAGQPIMRGLMKHTIGTTLARLHRALDEPSDEELSYARMAAAATQNAADAVAAYEASRKAAAAEAAAMRRGLVEARGAIEARQRAVLAAGSGQLKQLSDRLSGYIQNDVDRLMAGKPTSTEPASSGDVPRYLRPTAGQRTAGSIGEGPSTKPARLMAPLYELRRVEGNIHAALAGGRHSSTDAVARATALTVAREAAAAADWRPLSQYSVGTKDTRRRKMATNILYGLDLEQYAM